MPVHISISSAAFGRGGAARCSATSSPSGIAPPWVPGLPHSIKAQPTPVIRTPPRRKVRRSRPIADRERSAARHPDSQTVEIKIRVALINRFNSLGTAEIIRAA